MCSLGPLDPSFFWSSTASGLLATPAHCAVLSLCVYRCLLSPQRSLSCLYLPAPLRRSWAQRTQPTSHPALQGASLSSLGPPNQTPLPGSYTAPYLGSWILSDMSYWVVADRSAHKLLLSFCLWMLPAYVWPQKELRYGAGPRAQPQAPRRSRLTCQVSWALPELQSFSLLKTSGATSTVDLGLGKSITAQSLTARRRLCGRRARSGSCCIHVTAVGCRGYGGGRLGPRLRCIHH